MELLNKKATKKTPMVLFDHEKGFFHIKGRSIPENTYEFYSDLMNWLDDYSAEPEIDNIFRFELEYFNTSSSKFLLEIFKKLKSLTTSKKRCSLLVQWYYEDGDEEMMETGKDFMELLELNFEFKKTK